MFHAEGSWRTFIRWEPCAQANEVFLIRREADGTEAMVTGFALNTIPHHGVALGDDIKPIMDGTNFLQSVMDAAWEAGIRPSGYKDTERSITAMDAHLQDMRRLVFETPDQPKPTSFRERMGAGLL